jgi:DNA polymerase-3 subunit epsilon
MRQIVLDTETTGLSTADGHRIIEIGCIELIDRRITGRDYHRYIDPERDIDEGAERVHGISIDDLKGQPRFADIAAELLDFLAGAELVIHNAEFDVGFLEHELRLMGHPQPAIIEHASVLDTLSLARQLHPGQRNSLDALCKRYEVDATNRELHGALIDADLLARVYLAMTGGQAALLLDTEAESDAESTTRQSTVVVRPEGLNLVVVEADADEVAAHEAMLDTLEKGGGCVWRSLH